MKRRDVLKAGALLAAVGGVGGAVTATPREAREDRVAFKVVEVPGIPHIQVGGDGWEPTPEEIDAIVSTYVAAEKDSVSSFFTPHNVNINTLERYVLVKIPFTDLKTGDMFVLYEGTGELVTPDHPVNVCTSDAYLNNGVPTVETEPKTDIHLHVPARCPA